MMAVIWYEICISNISPMIPLKKDYGEHSKRVHGLTKKNFDWCVKMILTDNQNYLGRKLTDDFHISYGKRKWESNTNRECISKLNTCILRSEHISPSVYLYFGAAQISTVVDDEPSRQNQHVMFDPVSKN